MIEQLKLPLNDLGESPVWDEQKQTLYWVDILGKKVNSYRIIDKHFQSAEFNDLVGNVTLCEEGDLLVAVGNKILRVSNTFETIGELSAFELADNSYRFNDGKCDAAGRLNIGTTGLDDQKKSSCLYSLSESGALTAKIEGVTISNGLCYNR